jgi:hypothetical protein
MTLISAECAFVQEPGVEVVHGPAMRSLKLLTVGTLAAWAAGASSTPDPAMAELSWMSGQWCSSEGGEQVEEHWLAPRGDLMLGLSRTVKDGRTTSFEFLRIESREGGISYVAQPGGVPPTAFRLTAAGAQWARFENPQHDFPKRVEYRRVKTRLHAEIAGPGKDGREQVIGFDYRRCEATPPA